ncbi:MAG: UDP-N-acetylmuramoyl-tripeptide--D-alanyl-D-alanine ligase [Chloroflexota bacterium]
MARPIISTQITQHTLWQALSGETPPLALPPTPIGNAVINSQDVGPGDLFIALRGEQTDGHRFVGASFDAGAEAILCEPHAREQLLDHNVTIVDCTGASVTVHLGEGARQYLRIAYVVKSSQEGLQKVGTFQRLHRTNPDLRVIGITGSVGKSSTKELTAAVLRQHYRTLHSTGSLNNELGLPLTQLGLGIHHERAVMEMGMYALGEIKDLCTWARPNVGVVTNVGPVHLERLGTIERIVDAKSELVESLPSADEGGIAILNWDDERVRTMAERTSARIFKYGLTPEADLWADNIESAGLEGIRFRFHHRKPQGRWGRREAVETYNVKAPLLGRHSVHTALRAAAVGLQEGLSWEQIISCMRRMNNQLRLVVVPGLNDSTIIDDTYNASPASTIAALNLLHDLQPEKEGRRVAVLGDMLELGSYTDEGHKLVARRAADVADILFTVGELGAEMANLALESGLQTDQVYAMTNFNEAIERLSTVIQSDDLVLVKGSRAVGMEEIASAISKRRVSTP